MAFKGCSSRWGKSGFCSKSGQRFPSFKLIELKDDDPQAIKQEFVKIRQKVDALLSTLEKAPDPRTERQTTQEVASSGSSKDPPTNMKMATEDDSSSSSSGDWA
ncbi:heterogeneous nuclear ribonucleoprotein C-like 2 [Notamacropus eugenii]|uniref:heterogeneous nuclear ribonucleoprotein C-like 2 n=1 Tax=Notamacropus eugenii TaxID=9315 RepID=UPI003B673A6F